MRKITLTLLGALTAVFAFFGNAVAAPADQGSPKENWKEVFADGLFRADGTKLKYTDAFKKKRFVGLYASASWCAPCKHFTPRLIEFYEEFKDQMEVVLIGYDDTQDQVFKYMNDYKMPWLTVQKDSPGVAGYRTRNGIRGIPNFRFYDAKTGKLLVANEINLKVIRRIITGEKDTSVPGTNEDWDLFFKEGLLTANGKEAPLPALKKKRYIALYCASENELKCEKFTAELAAFYKKQKGKVEIVFYTYGKDKEAVLKYAKKTKMPWLVMNPNPGEVQRFLIKYKVRDLPDLRLFNAAGKELSKENLDLPKLNRLVR